MTTTGFYFEVARVFDWVPEVDRVFWPKEDPLILGNSSEIDS